MRQEGGDRRDQLARYPKLVSFPISLVPRPGEGMGDPTSISPLARTRWHLERQAGRSRVCYALSAFLSRLERQCFFAPPNPDSVRYQFRD